MSRKSLPVVLTAAEVIRLEQWIRAGSTPQQVVLRARIILGAVAGHSAQANAVQLGVQRRTVALWCRRVRTQGIGCVWEIATGRGRKPRYGVEQVGQWIEATLQTKPAGQTHWSTRSLAQAKGVSKSTIHRAWQDHGLKPHLSKSFKLSRDPKFLEKLTDVVGVYLTPPQNAVVLCVDEKSQIQALDRTQPGLPLKPGRCGTYTHDYKRNGTTTLFAALQLVEGRVIGQCYARHRHQEFLKFLRRLDDEFPGGKDLHLILDNYGTHGHPRVLRWLKRHPRFTLHFIPTSSSWLNLIERWFAELDQKAVRRGAFRSVRELQQRITEFLTAWNATPTPFVWTASVDRILEKIARARHRLEQVKPGSTRSKAPRKSRSHS
jgi:transposase